MGKILNLLFAQKLVFHLTVLRRIWILRKFHFIIYIYIYLIVVISVLLLWISMATSAYLTDSDLQLITEIKRFVITGGLGDAIRIHALIYTENCHCHISSSHRLWAMGLLRRKDLLGFRKIRICRDGTLILIVRQVGGEFRVGVWGVELWGSKRKFVIFGLMGSVILGMGVSTCIRGVRGVVFRCWRSSRGTRR